MLIRWLLLIVSLFPVSANAQDSSLRLITEQWAPMSYQTGTQPQGYMIDLVNLLKRQSPDLTSAEIEVLPWARGYAIAQSTANVLLFATSMNDERLSHFDFVGPVATTSVYLYAGADDPVSLTSLADLNNTDTVGVYRDSIGEGILRQAGGVSLLVASFPHQSARQLMRKRVRFWSQADVAVAGLLTEIGADMSQIKPVLKLKEIELYFAFSKGTDKAIVKQWHQALVAVKQSGQFERLYQKWFVNFTAPTKTQIIWRQP